MAPTRIRAILQFKPKCRKENEEVQVQRNADRLDIERSRERETGQGCL